MILSSELYKQHGVRKGIVILIKYVMAKYLKALVHLFKKNNDGILYHSTYYAKGIRNYPKLVTDDENNLKCISCGLCEKACPTECISIQHDDKVKIPKTLTTGPIPLAFDIQLHSCTRCGYCVEVCPVDAIELTGFYDFFSRPAKSSWNKNELASKDIES